MNRTQVKSGATSSNVVRAETGADFRCGWCCGGLQQLQRQHLPILLLSVDSYKARSQPHT
jgi:bacterioferritin-associated ferredoxin